METRTNQVVGAGRKQAARLTEYAQQARHFVAEHPTLALAAVAGAGLLFASRFAAGALVGIGTAALLTERTGPQTRQLLRERGAQAYEWGRTESERVLQRAKQLLPLGEKVVVVPTIPVEQRNHASV